MAECEVKVWGDWERLTLAQALEYAPKSERALNASVRLVTRDGDSSLYAETQRADGGWVHRNYLTG